MTRFRKFDAKSIPKDMGHILRILGRTLGHSQLFFRYAKQVHTQNLTRMRPFYSLFFRISPTYL